MNYRRFGRTGWQVSEIGYGMWGMGGWTGSDDDESLQALQRAVELGCNFFDTAWGYGDGPQRGAAGRSWCAPTPASGSTPPPRSRPRTSSGPAAREFTLDDCFPPDHIEEYVHSSLKNLGWTAFDLIQFHVWEDVWARGRPLARKRGRPQAPGADPAPSASASTAGSRGTASRPCAAG